MQHNNLEQIMQKPDSNIQPFDHDTTSGARSPAPKYPSHVAASLCVGAYTLQGAVRWADREIDALRADVAMEGASV